MDNFDEERDAYKALKYGQPSANDLVAAADIIKELVDRASEHTADTFNWDSN